MILLPPDVLSWCVAVGGVAAVVVLWMTIGNLRRYQTARATGVPDAELPTLAVCIPARNEEQNLGACLGGLLASDYPAAALTVLVYDDESTDGTGRILAEWAARDERVRPVPSVALPPGWNGKQHACWRMGREAAARGASWMLFTDADVRFERHALRDAMREALRLDGDASSAARAPLGLLSTFPRQIAATLGERLLVPMILFLLLGYLPIGRMRRTLEAASSAGCGQFLLVRREAYEASGGHAAFRSSMHDGIMMPRAVRRAGFRTDLYDGSDACSVRMYRGFGAAWRGFAKNAYEGLGNPFLLVFLTVIHLLGHVLPWIVLGWAAAARFGGVEAGPSSYAIGAALVAGISGLLTRGVLAARFTPPSARTERAIHVLLHPLAIVLMTGVQWHSFLLHMTGRRRWRGRLATSDVMVTPTASGPMPSDS